MRRAMTRLLSKGIAHLTEGGTLREYMSRPESVKLSSAKREELKSLLETAAHLLQLSKVPIPAPTMQTATRAWFLSHVAKLGEERRARTWRGWPRLRTNLARGLARVALVAVVLLAAGGGAASVSAGSLPGSPLYPIKLAAEDFRLAFTLDPAARAELNMRFANERTTEMVRLAEEGQPLDEAVVERMGEQLYQAVLAAESTSVEQRRGLLERVIANTSLQQEELRRASTDAAPEAQTTLVAGVAAAEKASRQAQQALDSLPTSAPMADPPTDTPTHTPSKPAVIATATTIAPTLAKAPTHTPGEPPVAAVPTATSSPPTQDPTATSMPSGTPTPATATPTHTGTTAPGLTLTPAATATPAVGPAKTRTQTKEPSPQPSETVQIATLTPAPSGTPEPTQTPVIRFRVTKKDRADPVPATHRIHYEICVYNDGDVALTNVILLDRWSPTSRAYLPPDNPLEKLWNIGTVKPHERRCVQFC